MISATLSHTLTTLITYHGLAIHSRSLGPPGSNRARTDERETGKTRSRDVAQHPPGHNYKAYGRTSHLHLFIFEANSWASKTFWIQWQPCKWPQLYPVMQPLPRSVCEWLLRWAVADPVGTVLHEDWKSCHLCHLCFHLQSEEWDPSLCKLKTFVEAFFQQFYPLHEATDAMNQLELCQYHQGRCFGTRSRLWC